MDELVLVSFVNKTANNTEPSAVAPDPRESTSMTSKEDLRKTQLIPASGATALGSVMIAVISALTRHPPVV